MAALRQRPYGFLLYLAVYCAVRPRTIIQELSDAPPGSGLALMDESIRTIQKIVARAGKGNDILPVVLLI